MVFPGVRFLKGNFVFGVLNKFLGVNGEKVEAYPQENEDMSETWTAEQVNVDSTETAFARITLNNKMATGAWPFECEKLIPCGDLPKQTCGCDHFVNDGSIEKMGIVYNLGTDSEISKKIDFRTCEELKSHGVSISGYFVIDEEKTYCSNWSKFILS